MLSNAHLQYFDSEVLRLPTEKRTEYHAQVDRLIKALRASVKENTKIKITDVVKAGSFAKFTILRKTTEDPVDVDLVFYICGKSVEGETHESLSSQIYDLLVDLYPNKEVEDFEIQKKAATVIFKGTGLAVDIVPVIQIEGQPGYGYQFGTDGSITKTCAPCQIQFVRTRKNGDRDYRTLVRLGKKWRNYKEINPLKSFHVELLFAHLQDRDGQCEDIEQRLRDFFLYIAQSELRELIRFPENQGALADFKNPVVIVDPVNNSNNTAARITDEERKTIVSTALDAWEAANFASTENDPEVWKELFGPRFKTKD
jgi:Second Messenger Oligonucleotide or Dinucleotide Synthetase domain